MFEIPATSKVSIVGNNHPRGIYAAIIKIIDKDIEDLVRTTFYPKLLIAGEKARYINTKDNPQKNNFKGNTEHTFVFDRGKNVLLR
ncbi:MAG: hypothetical protein Kow0098_24150 [Ignavibacteriaceae bacterium]